MNFWKDCTSSHLEAGSERRGVFSHRMHPGLNPKIRCVMGWCSAVAMSNADSETLTARVLQDQVVTDVTGGCLTQPQFHSLFPPLIRELSGEKEEEPRATAAGLISNKSISNIYR